MSKVTSSANFSIEKFDGKTSFTQWQRKMKDLLVQQGLMRPLLGNEEGQPDDMKDIEWAELEQRCVSTIRLCIGDNVFNHVIDEDSALRLWAKLEKIYLAKSFSNKLQLRRKLYCLKMEENGDLMIHMNEFDGIIDQLKKDDVKVEEEENALLFLASLLDSYEVFVESLICGIDTITLEQAQATLMSREARKKSKEWDRDPNGLALVIEANRRKSTSKGSKGGKSRSNNVQCFKCKGYEHIKRDCPTKGDESNENKDECAFVAEGNDCDVLTISENMDANSYWYLDSASATHICYQKDCFDLLQKGVAENLTLGNKSIVKVMGIGVVKIKMFDGVVRSLGGVAYVQKMRKNLISLSLLDSKGYGYSACDGVVKVTQGDMVLMRGNLHNGLYRLECEASKGWKQCTGDGSYQSEISFAEEVMKGSHGVDDGERTKNLASSELEGSSSALRALEREHLVTLSFALGGGRVDLNGFGEFCVLSDALRFQPSPTSLDVQSCCWWLPCLVWVPALFFGWFRRGTFVMGHGGDY
ncbi:zinc finger protein [Theobroma cacao]|nr:zinc finger protein [Theobroma cacao]